MILGIDASNISTGGGLNHLKHLLHNAEPTKFGFSEVVIWGSKKTLSAIDDRPWLRKHSPAALGKNLLFRSYWRLRKLSILARQQECDLLFVPGGSYIGNYSPVVAMSRNLLPFEWRELRRYGFSLLLIKFMLLRIAQTKTYRSVDGIIFLNEYAELTVRKVIKETNARVAIISHGVDNCFFREPKQQLELSENDDENNPIRVIYVSIIDYYKHQWNVVGAIKKLREQGLPMQLELIGPANSKALKILESAISKYDPTNEFCSYLGSLPNETLPAKYKHADICIFASSCENMPNILLEGMASGLPIACSNKGPMPGILGNAGVYFDPENIEEITSALKALVQSSELRKKCARHSYRLAKNYSWKTCADDTFGFLMSIAEGRS